MVLRGVCAVDSPVVISLRKVIDAEILRYAFCNGHISLVECSVEDQAAV